MWASNCSFHNPSCYIVAAVSKHSKLHLWFMQGTVVANVQLCPALQIDPLQSNFACLNTSAHDILTKELDTRLLMPYQRHATHKKAHDFHATHMHAMH